MKRLFLILFTLFFISIISGCTTPDDPKFYNPSGEQTLYTISIAKNIQNGTVKSNKESCAAGETVTLTVSPNEGYKLESLSVLDSNGNTIPLENNVFVMPKNNVVITATFVVSTTYYSITINSEIQNGVVTVNKTQATAGETITVSISPNDGYSLSSLSVSDSNNNAITVTDNTFTMPECNVTINASFTQAVTYYSIIINSVINGEILSNKTSATPGETVTLTVSPNEGFELDTLSVKDSNGHTITLTNNTFTMPDSNVTVSASFKAAITYYSVTINSCENGSVSSSKTSATTGETVALTITPNTGYLLESIVINTSTGISVPYNINDKITFVMPSDNVFISASFYSAAKATVSTLSEIITNLFQDTTIILTGSVSSSDLESIRNAIIASNYKIILDLRNVLSLDTLPSNSFYNCTKLQKVFLPNTIVTIGSQCFDSCNNLSAIEISSDNNYFSTEDGVLFNKNKSILLECPNGKQGLYVIPETVSIISKSAFSGCSELTGVNFSNTLESIGDYGFTGCIKLSSIVIPNSVTDIGNNAFDNCSALSSVTLSNSLEKINQGVFRYCTSLESIIIPNNVTTIEYIAFENCTKLQDITIPNSVSSIKSYAFRKCSNITTITLPNSVKIIENGAFDDCSKLTDFTISKSVENIASEIFRNCNSLLNINADTNNPYYSSIDGVLFNKNKTTILIYPRGRENSYNIPNTVTTIGPYAFSGCAFTSIDITNSITNIENNAFFGCKNLANIVLPSSILNIGNSAFANCTSLESISIPSSVISIGIYAFYNCSNLITLYFEDTDNWYRTNIEDDWINKTNGGKTDLSNNSVNILYFKDYGYFFWYKTI